MNDDKRRQEDASTADLSAPVATSDDSDYSLTVEEALARYIVAGLPRSTRSIQRYCRKGYLKARRVDTEAGDKFLITPDSVDLHIAYINEVRQVATGRDLSRHDATAAPLGNKDEITTDQGTDDDDRSRQPTTGEQVSPQVAAKDDAALRYVARLEEDNEFLRDQIKVKDEQIRDLAAHARSTNNVIAAIARRLPLLGMGGATPSNDEEGDNGQSDPYGG